MTTIIRSARLAAELKTVPVPSLHAEVLKIPVHVQPRAYGQPVEQVPSQAQIRLKEQTPPVVAAPVVPTYEEYKQRLGGELAALRQQAIDSGREEGLKQAWQTVEAHYKQQLETLRVLIESVRDARQRYVEDVGDEALEIVFVAVTKILGTGFATREAAVAAVREAIRCCKERGRMLVKVAPEDFELLNARRRELLEGGSASEVELVADEQVKWGGCLLEGASGNLDARLETQLQRLRDTLLRARENWANPIEISTDE
jgi:flagellar biosynthesis/type III secretory pathway protein FliH